MHIILLTPAPPGSRAGNRATAERWAWLLEQEGHQVTVVTDYQGEACDLFIALHAWRSHEAVRQFREAHPDTPLIVVLTGTDIYDHQHRFPDETHYSMAQADCLIGLHRRVHQDIPARFADKLVTVLQSANFARRESAVASQRTPFQVCVIGHLRAEKDSLRAAKAARLLPERSTIKVINAGSPHTPEWQLAAEDEQASNPRFQWLGEIGRAETQRLMVESDVMVISSIMEGGANVVSEACRMGLPVLASDISGNIGLLGEDYPGYFRTGDEQDLARLLLKTEASEDYLAELQERVEQCAAAFTPAAEQAALAAALEQATAQHRGFTQSE